MECKEGRTENRSKAKAGINRNIVECKEIGQDGDASCCEVLIETLWNVKSDTTVRATLATKY